ncbi:MAG: MFS transporter [Promethearchaeota archaeon]
MESSYKRLASLLKGEYFVHGIVSVFTDIARMYYLKQGGWSLVSVILLNGIVESPLVFHIPMGHLIDYRVQHHNTSYRRMLLETQLCMFGLWLLMFFFSETHYLGLGIMYLGEVCVSLWIVAIDALSSVVSKEENRTKHPEAAGKFQPAIMQLMFVGNMVGSLSSGYFIKFFSIQLIFLIQAMCALGTALVYSSRLNPALIKNLTFEEETPKPNTKHFNADYVQHTPKFTLNESVHTIHYKSRQNACVKLLKRVRELMRVPILYYYSIFLFCLHAVPNASVAMFYYLTDLLGFTPENMGQLDAGGSFMIVFALALYDSNFKEMPLRKYLIGILFSMTLFSAGPILLVSRDSERIGFSDFEMATCIPVFIYTCVIMSNVPYNSITALYVKQDHQASLMATFRSIPMIGRGGGFLMSLGLAHLYDIDHGDYDGMESMMNVCMMFVLLPMAAVVIGIPNKSSAELMLEISDAEVVSKPKHNNNPLAIVSDLEVEEEKTTI